jgi:putative ABC transport system permease protein
MKSYDALELAGRNLRESVLRNGLTTMGIAVGVASLVAMMALGVGLQQLANRRLARSGLFDSVIVYQQREFDPQAGGSGGNRTAPRAQDGRPVDEAARVELAKLPGVVEAYPDIRFGAEVRYGEASRFSTIAAVPMSGRDNDAFAEMKGHFFSADNADEAILKEEFAKQLAGSAAPESLLGREISLRYAERRVVQNNSSPADGARAGSPASTRSVPTPNAAGGADFADWGFSVIPREQKLKVVGIVEQEPVGGMRMLTSGRVMLPLATAMKLNTFQGIEMRSALRGQTSAAKGPVYQTVVLKLKSPSVVQGVEDGAKKMGFATFSLLDATKNLRRFFTILDLFLGIFGSLALAVASLGIVNTLVMAILERRREIGIMKAIGASDADVRSLFFAEAGAMGAAGGALGVALGWAIGRTINLGTNIYLQRQELPAEQIWSTPWWLVAGAIGFAIIVSLISGLYPASRAARLDPVQALRYE